MTPSNTTPITLDPNNRALLVYILRRHEARCKVLYNLTHTTEAEKEKFLQEMSVCQYAYLQLEGVEWKPEADRPDWSSQPAPMPAPFCVECSGLEAHFQNCSHYPKPSSAASAEAHKAGTHPDCSACEETRG